MIWFKLSFNSKQSVFAFWQSSPFLWEEKSGTIIPHSSVFQQLLKSQQRQSEEWRMSSGEMFPGLSHYQSLVPPCNICAIRNQSSLDGKEMPDLNFNLGSMQRLKLRLGTSLQLRDCHLDDMTDMIRDWKELLNSKRSGVREGEEEDASNHTSQPTSSTVISGLPSLHWMSLFTN